MATCDLCSQFENRDNKAVCQIRMRSKISGEMVSNVCVCARCKEKFEEDELPKCERCGRLKTQSNFEFSSGKYVCDCVRDNEDLEEKELPLLPGEEISQSAFYERQINGLREELVTAEEALEIEREEVAKFHEKSKE